jgi:hypothetical protein
MRTAVDLPAEGPVERAEKRSSNRRREQEGDIVVRLTTIEARVVLAALNTALNRPALFRPPVIAMAEDLAGRLIGSLRMSRPDEADAPDASG